MLKWMNVGFLSMLAAAMVLVGHGVSGQTARPTPTTAAVVDEDAAGVHELFERLSKEFPSAADQTKPMAELERKTVDEFKTGRQKKSGAFVLEAIRKIQPLLSAADQKKLEAEILEETQKSRRRLLIVLHRNLFDYVLPMRFEIDPPEKPDKPKPAPVYPDDLSALVAPRSGQNPAKQFEFLTSFSKSSVPQDWQSLTENQKRDWVKSHSEVLFLAGGLPFDTIDKHFVVACVDPNVATDGNCFLISDGGTFDLPADRAAKALAQIREGKNPPPELTVELKHYELVQTTERRLEKLVEAANDYRFDHESHPASDIGSIGPAKLPPETYLAADSKKVPPADWETLSTRARTAWINRNSDFAYVDRMTVGERITALTIVAYLKPGVSEVPVCFMNRDLLTLHPDPADVAKSVEEANDGKNLAELCSPFYIKMESDEETKFNLQKLGRAWREYADMHSGHFPPTPGTDCPPNVRPAWFLTADSKTLDPDGWVTMTDQQRRDWADSHTDFVYLAGDFDRAKADANPPKVTAYVKPESVYYSVSFILSSGVPVDVQKDKAAAVIKELTDGQNPPPSLYNK